VSLEIPLVLSPLNAPDEETLYEANEHCCENSSLLANFIPTSDSID